MGDKNVNLFPPYAKLRQRFIVGLFLSGRYCTPRQLSGSDLLAHLLRYGYSSFYKVAIS